MKKAIKKILPKTLIDRYHMLSSFLGAMMFGFPGKKIKIIGVTGTNGKSTVVNFIAKIFKEAGFKVATSSSVSFEIGDKEELNNLRMTMPGGFLIQKFLKKAVDEKCDYVILEVTSEGIKQHRHEFIDFNVAVLTNLTPEHIESHGGFENYKNAKGKLFNITKKFHIINIDDEYKDFFLQFSAQDKIVYGLNENTTSHRFIKATDIHVTTKGTKFRVNGLNFNLKVLGRFNVYNALAAISVALSENIDLSVCQTVLDKAKGVPGRMEEVVSEPFRVIVDYAFTPNALNKVYSTIKNNFQPKNMICVLGSCGGGRDKWKRPVLGGLAEKYCDKIIVTNEDPYDEDPLEIINQVAEGAKGRAIKIIDRKEAIEKAITMAQKDDVVIITGKGCEPSICLAHGEQISWDDRKVAKEAYNSLE
ncbi:MAG: UDP-N-acetylmuramoyl-L-alanyl-D-glutamate--2,6-diaminopimelate ligase [Patescibacteria group bacterium]